MKKINYKILKKSDLEDINQSFIFYNGFNIYLEFKNKEVLVRLNDELLDKSFSQKDIKLLSSRFLIKNPVIESSWKEQKGKVLFHDNDLNFGITFDSDTLYILIKFVFEKLYKITDQILLTVVF